MNLTERLIISSSPISLIKEGTFLRLYNESLFAAYHHLNLQCKPMVKHIKKLDRIIVFGGFPVGNIYKHFPQAEQTPFGFQIRNQNWDLTNYAKWYQTHCQIMGQFPSTPTTFAEHEPIETPVNEVIAQQINKANIGPTLSVQQVSYLLDWYEGKYPLEVDFAFMKNLRQQILNGNSA